MLTVEKGASVTSVSKSGTIPKWANNEEWTDKVDWKSADLLSSQETLDSAVGSPDAVVSCVGVVGTDADELLKGNGDANVAAFNSAKRVGKLQRVAYVSVSSEVDACKENWLPGKKFIMHHDHRPPFDLNIGYSDCETN